MVDDREVSSCDQLGARTKRCYFAGRAIMDAVLRPYDLGSVRWYVLYQLATGGPTMQRDLVRMLEVERATMTGIIAALVRKGLVEQAADQADQRQKRVCMTAAGAKLWGELPDLGFVRAAAFEGIDATEVAIAVSVLQTATQRLEALLQKGPYS